MNCDCYALASLQVEGLWARDTNRTHAANAVVILFQVGI